MTLFLTSSPCDDHVPDGCGLPCIYFERNAFVANLRAAVPEGARGLIIAAWPGAHAHNDEMADTFAGCFAHHGIHLSEFVLLDSRNQAEAASLVAQSGVILLAGGHVPTENAFFEEVGLRELLSGYDGVVMGISAGSMNAADTVYVQPEEAGEAVDPYFVRWTQGLGLTDKNILPHYNVVKDNILDGMRLFEDITYPDSAGHPLYVLVDGSYILERNGESVLHGEGYLLHNGVMEKICEDGASVCL
ncbi:MAG: Type 1 glutamine amidotransferase-like domain-containing protein [Clostridia bacterium]|nr:Type 1 glutamine amidotransferase-like domain-containing protein [Clostridia bacterium]